MPHTQNTVMPNANIKLITQKSLQMCSKKLIALIIYTLSNDRWAIQNNIMSVK